MGESCCKPCTQHTYRMCLAKVTAEKIKNREELLEDISPSDHPSMEQFTMLLNLLPNTNNIINTADDVDILMAAVDYIVTLKNQLQNKLKNRSRREKSEH